MTRLRHPLVARPSRARLAVLLAALLAAPAASAQLGIDLSAPPKKERRTRKAPRKTQEKPTRKAPEPPAPPVEAPAARREEPPAPPAAPPPPPPEEAAPARPQTGITLAPVDEKATAAAKARLEAAKKLLDERATETAALAFDQILREPALSSVHDEARYQRAKALARLGLGYSALTAFDAILAQGPSGTRFFPSAMEWLFTIGRELENEQPLLARVARYAGRAMPPAQEDRIHFLLAKYQFERGRALLEAGRASEAKAAFDEARRLAAKVRPDGSAPVLPGVEAAKGVGEASREEGWTVSVQARAKLLDGLVLYAQGDDQAATEAFKDVVRMTNPRKMEKVDVEVRELAFLQLARVHYQNRQNRYAIFYYGKMPWGGERWLEGLWEASYAHYRIGDFEKALGNLLTLQSPYFRDDYFPESYVLKAIVYYENCRYPEARRVLDQLSSNYDPVYDELVRITGERRTADGYHDLVRQEGTRPGPARKILKVALSDQDIRRLEESIGGMDREADEELGRMRAEFRQSALGKELADALRAERTSLVQELGARARAKLEYERDQLRQLLAQALRIQIEVSRKEREALEGSLAKGSQVDVVRDLKYSHAVSDEHLYWPYEGEFWRDELGTYSYTLTKGCKDRLARPRTAAR